MDPVTVALNLYMSVPQSYLSLAPTYHYSPFLLSLAPTYHYSPFLLSLAPTYCYPPFLLSCAPTPPSSTLLPLLTILPPLSPPPPLLPLPPAGCSSNGLTGEDLAASLATVQSLATACGAEVHVLRERPGEVGSTAEVLVRRKVEEDDFLEVR